MHVAYLCQHKSSPSSLCCANLLTYTLHNLPFLCPTRMLVLEPSMCWKSSSNFWRSSCPAGVAMWPEGEPEMLARSAATVACVTFEQTDYHWLVVNGQFCGVQWRVLGTLWSDTTGGMKTILSGITVYLGCFVRVLHQNTTHILSHSDVQMFLGLLLFGLCCTSWNTFAGTYNL